MDKITNERLLDLIIKPFKIFVGKNMIKTHSMEYYTAIKNKEALYVLIENDP